MATNYSTHSETSITPKTVYTFDEAIRYMKMRDRYPTRENITWVSVRTGRPVSIGYN